MHGKSALMQYGGAHKPTVFNHLSACCGGKRAEYLRHGRLLA